jgi:hypothetical protein
MRRRIALAVIALHCLLLWLLAVGFRHSDDRPEPPQLQIVSLWITTPPPPMQAIPVEPPPPEEASERTSSSRPTVAPRRIDVPVTPPLEPRTESNAPSVTTAPLVDWRNEASQVARRAGNAIGGPPPREGFSEPPKVLPKACVPKESSLKWKDENTSKGGSCALTLGYSCRDRANWHLFDDMKDPQRAPSSVPDPNICD